MQPEWQIVKNMVRQHLEEQFLTRLLIWLCIYFQALDIATDSKEENDAETCVIVNP